LLRTAQRSTLFGTSDPTGTSLSRCWSGKQTLQGNAINNTNDPYLDGSRSPLRACADDEGFVEIFRDLPPEAAV